MDTGKVTAAAKGLARAEAKLAKLTSGRDAAVTKAVTDATKKANDKYDAKITAATAVVEAGKKELQTLVA